MASEEDTVWVWQLDYLRIRLSARYARTGALADLEEALKISRQVVDMTPIDHPDRAMRLNGLANRLSDRYLEVGKIDDLEEAIRVGRQALDAVTDGYSDRAVYLNDLAADIGDRYKRMGEIADLEEAIRLTEQAVDMTPANHPKRAIWLSNLGARLHDRYSKTRAMSDLEEAIRLARQVIHINLNRSDRAGRLYNLARYLGDKYSRTRIIVDLEESIQIGRQAVDMAPIDYLNRASYLNNLGTQIFKKYSRTSKLADLEEAIQIARSAINTTSQEHPERPVLLYNLGTRLKSRYKNTGEISDLEEVIRLKRQAVGACSENHRGYAALLNGLAAGLIQRFRRTKATADFEEAKVHLHSALLKTNAATITRIQAGQALLMACISAKDWQQAYNASNIAIHLIPRLTSRSLENSDKQHVLRQIVGLASYAAAVALMAGKRASIALSFLEQGRNLLASSLEEIRTDLLDLRKSHPELADAFVRFRDELDLPFTAESSSLVEDRVLPRWGEANRRYDAGNELDRVIADIRQRPGFGDFMAIPGVEEMQAAASSGPIVVINVSRFCCDALLVEKDRIRALFLPRLRIKDIKEKENSGNLGRPTILEWLWDVAAHPILDALGFSQPPSADMWPRVWWIPTGPLSKFPLHAAGRHNKRSAETVLDRVMSSYASAIKTIVHSRRRGNTQITSSTPGQALLVAMEHTPGHAAQLPFASKEIEMLHYLCKSITLDPIEPGRRKHDIMSLLPSCKIFHVAGHGYTNDQDPLKSYLILGDEKQELLTVSDLLEMNLRESLPFLAYLSACGTGRIKDNESVDESIHLISACQIAGFRHVIGTLWEVNDAICLDVARITYEGIRDRGMTDGSVCWGLHKATTELRDRWLGPTTTAQRGKLSTSVDAPLKTDAMGFNDTRDEDQRQTQLSRDIVLCDEDERENGNGDIMTGPSHWVAYVHYGI
ncbi:hypothetical protein HD806DRAFT_504428 [Xylariaceae sp. AK1471]|nr:hypothetical protein HD806DRAFT_504428 [Xylariaceae sp. AK1471]